MLDLVSYRYGSMNIDRLTGQHLGRNIGRLWKLIRYVFERWPYGNYDSVYTLSPRVGIETVPEEAHQHSNEHHYEREIEPERRATLDRVRDVIPCANNGIGGNRKCCQEVSEEDYTDSSPPGKSHGHDTRSESKITRGHGITEPVGDIC